MTPLDSRMEEPVFFPAGGETLFGIHTHPSGPRRGVGVVIVAGGDNVNAAMSRNGIGVRMARRLAEEGYDVLRFTYHGVGESTGVVEALHLHRPFTDDVVGAAEYLASRGLNCFVLVGSCFGSRTALSAAPLIADTAGVVLVTPPSAGYDRAEAMAEWMARNRTFGEYARRGFTWGKVKDLFDRGKRSTYLQLLRKKCSAMCRRVLCRIGLLRDDRYDWVSPMFLAPLQTMVDREVPVLFAFGTHDAWGDEFREAAAGPLGPILEAGTDTIDVIEDLPGVAHGLVRVAVQEAFMEVALDWIHGRVPGTVVGAAVNG
jgi:dienelactone hydrolase